MSEYIFLGHGGYDERMPPGYPPAVLIPPNTTLKFYSDAGQPLLLPGLGGKTNYAKVVPAWQQLKDRGPGLTTTMQTYNFSLVPETHEEERQAIAKADWNGAVPITLPAGEVYLCQGTPDKCPTPELLTSTDEKVISDPQRWIHNCDGFLGLYGKDNNVLHWAACTSFVIDRQDLPSDMTSGAKGPGTTPVAPDWVPTDAEYDRINNQSRTNLGSLAPNAKASITVGGIMLVIGSGHGAPPIAYLDRQQDREQGLITAKKGAFGDSYQVSGLSKGKQAMVKQALAKLTDKKITFA